MCVGWFRRRCRHSFGIPIQSIMPKTSRTYGYAKFGCRDEWLTSVSITGQANDGLGTEWWLAARSPDHILGGPFFRADFSGRGHVSAQVSGRRQKVWGITCDSGPGGSLTIAEGSEVDGGLSGQRRRLESTRNMRALRSERRRPGSEWCVIS